MQYPELGYWVRIQSQTVALIGANYGQMSPLGSCYSSDNSILDSSHGESTLFSWCILQNTIWASSTLSAVSRDKQSH